MKPKYAPTVHEQFHARTASDDAGVPRTRAAVASSVAMYRIGGREYPFRSQPNCLTCQSHHRVEIENALLKGYGYRTIIEGLPESAGLTAHHLENHVRYGHLPLDQHIRRAIIEDRAEEAGKNLEEATTTLVDHIAFARLGIQNVFEDVVMGRQQVTVRDGVRLANMLAKVDQIDGGGEVDRAMITRAFMVFVTIIEKHTSREVFDAISREIVSNPVLKGLHARMLDSGDEDRVVDPYDGED